MRWVLVVSLAAAAGIHLAVGHQHGLTGSHGAFFLAAGLAQATAAIALTRRGSRRWADAAAALSAALVATWLAVKAPGVVTGSDVDPLGVVATIVEVVAVAAALGLRRRPLATPAPASRSGTVLGLVALLTVGLVVFGGGGHSDHDHGPSAPAAGAPVPVLPGAVLDHHGGSPDPHDGAGSDHDESADGRTSDARDGSDDDHHHDDDAHHDH